MTDKIEKKEATFAVPYNSEDNNDYVDGEVVQHIEYVPFGEVFVEERNNIWNTPYLFNAKEFDEETGLYYYGARYYDPRLSLWLSIDPKEEKYSNVSTYCYVISNPLKYTDPTGMEIDMTKVRLADEQLKLSTTQSVTLIPQHFDLTLFISS